MSDFLTATKDGVILAIKVQPRSSKNQLVGSHAGVLKVKLTAPPVDGSANRCCCDFLAQLLSVPVRDIDIIAGATSRHKRVLVKGLRISDVVERLDIENNE